MLRATHRAIWMTFATRDWYRHEVERIAKRTRLREDEVARRAIALALEHDALPASDCRRHVGYYLVDHGWRQLVERTGYRAGPREALHRWVCRHPTVVFVGGLMAAVVGAVAALLWLAEPVAHPDWPLLILLTLVLGDRRRRERHEPAGDRGPAAARAREA